MPNVEAQVTAGSYKVCACEICALTFLAIADIAMCDPTYLSVEWCGGVDLRKTLKPPEGTTVIRY